MYGVKELMRRLAHPSDGNWKCLKWIARYILGLPRLVAEYRWNTILSAITVFVDSNFAGCLETRKSTSGGVVLWGGWPIKAYSRTQSIIALSSGEAELAAVVRGATEGLGLASIMADFGQKCHISLRSDATAAIGMCKRQGLGRVRHLATADLWVQQRVRKGDFSLHKHPGKDNPADVLTKFQGRGAMMHLLNLMSFKPMGGRPSIAPDRWHRSGY